MKYKTFYFLIILTVLAIVPCFSQAVFKEDLCPCRKDTAELFIPVDDDTFSAGMAISPMSNSDKLSKSADVMATFTFLDLLRYDKNYTWQEMTNGIAYRDDIAIAARTINKGMVTGDTWTVDLVLPDGRMAIWPNVIYYENLDDGENCYFDGSRTFCDACCLEVTWILEFNCRPIGIYTFRFYQNGSIIHTENFEVKEIPFDHFAVSFDKDSVAYGSEARIYVNAVDENNEAVALCPDARIDISLDEKGALYGNLSNIFGERGKNLSNVPYILALTGLVNYVVDGEDPNGPKEITISVSNSDGKSGSGSLVVVDSILFALEIPEPKEVWPTIPAAQGGNPNNRNVKDNILVTLTKNLKPYPEQNVTTTVRMILPSGGHDHTNQPPQNLLGQLRNMRANDVGSGRITTQTFTDGTILLSDKTSEIGGEFEFTATTTIGGKKLEATDTLTVRVPGLEQLDASVYLTKVGGTTSHHGPQKYTEDHNHYGTAAMNDALLNIAIEWHSSFPREQLLLINDMSLPLGGVFDVNGNWKPPHNTHRIGKSADIRTELPGRRTGAPVRTPRNATDWENTIWVGNKDFEDMCGSYGGRVQRHSPNTKNEHYHIDFYANEE